jgi:hypothetical protein
LVRLRRVRDAGLGETIETAEQTTTPVVPSFATASFNGDALNVLNALRQEAIAFRAAAENVVR